MLTIDWASLGVVAVVAIGATILLGFLYSFGVRLLAAGRTDDRSPVQHGIPYFGAIVCFAICAAAVLFGLWVIIPQLHPAS